MSEYLLLFRGGDHKKMESSPEEMQAHMGKWMEWMGGLREQGKFIGAQPLEMSGHVITGTDKVISDGPYMEGKEMVGGYLACYADSYEEALAIANNCPILEDDGSVEVRELRNLDM